MAVTNEVAIAFCNNEIRPICELARKFAAQVTNMETSWFAGLNTLIPNDAQELIADGRDVEEGVTPITGADVHSVMGIIIAMRNAQNTEILEKPTVRPLEVV